MLGAKPDNSSEVSFEKPQRAVITTIRKLLLYGELKLVCVEKGERKKEKEKRDEERREREIDTRKRKERKTEEREMERGRRNRECVCE